MNTVFTILIVTLGVLHLGIMGLEMFASQSTQANAFDMDAEFVAQSGAQTALKNQGIYNGMLGALLVASAFLPAGQVKVMAQLGLALFVLIVGIFGGLTATKKIFLVQALPAAITIALGLLAY
ncbi:DUF1304 domain-containing protein [Lacticaseibacillus pantheris]|nr:DUF1304 domain-containing protein [Lacticaseibacillus pantheris]